MIKLPLKRKLSCEERIEYYQEELRKKDALIKRLREENELLIRASIRSAKRRVEELNGPDA